MSNKIYKPSDFDIFGSEQQFREEIENKVAAQIQSSNFEKLNNGIKLIITDSQKSYTKENLIDFQSSYAISGGWRIVDTNRNKAEGTITVELKW